MSKDDEPRLINRFPIVYFNGGFVPYQEACVPLDTHALHYGTGCFEGIRGYWNEEREKLLVFRLTDHFARLARSSEMLGMTLPDSVEGLSATTVELLRRNSVRTGVYIRPVVYKKSQDIFEFDLSELEDGFMMTLRPLGHFLNVSEGISVVTSPWQRGDARVMPPAAKPTGLYLNTALAKTDALRRGAGEAILLNADGTVAEGSAENIFLVVGGTLVTPSTDQNILEGITRRTVIDLAMAEFGIPTVERPVLKKELYDADGMFMVGTGAEVTPVIAVDGKPVGDGAIGSVTRELQKLYFNVVHGNNPKYYAWLTEV